MTRAVGVFKGKFPTIPRIQNFGSLSEILRYVVVSQNDCWEWQCVLLDGYGQVVVDGRTMAAHRYCFTITKGLITPGFLICHTCDNRRCIRPSHLFEGTAKDNCTDKILKGRDYDRNGASNSNAKLTLNEIIQIREIGHSVQYKQTAQKFGVTPEMVSLIVRNKAWRNDVSIS